MNVDQLMREIQDEVAKRRHGGNASAPERHVQAHAEVSGHWSPVGNRLPMKQAYALGELLELDDIDFVETAYRTLLRRPADPGGLAYSLRDLRSGSRNKVHILGDIRFSEEGMSRCVHVDGLLLPYKLQQWSRRRLIGRPLAWLLALARLPTYMRRLERADARQAQEVQELGRYVNSLGDSLKEQVDELEKGFEREMRAGQAAIEAMLQSQGQTINSLGQQLAAIAPVLEKLEEEERNDFGRLGEGLEDLKHQIGQFREQSSKLQRQLVDGKRTSLELEHQVRRVLADSVSTRRT